MDRPKYEYTEITVRSCLPPISQLNDLGEQGWELVGWSFESTVQSYVLKRQKR
jgi:hypothetical protein